MTEGFVRADRIDFNAFHEAEDLIDQVEGYRVRFGYYPGRILADKIYWTQKNRKWLRDRQIEIGGVPLGRKPQKTKYQKEKERRKNNQRSEVEGKFGEVKERYGIDRIYTRLPQTTLAEISLIMLSVNLIKLLREVGDTLLSSFPVYWLVMRSLYGAYTARITHMVTTRGQKGKWNASLRGRAAIGF